MYMIIAILLLLIEQSSLTSRKEAEEIMKKQMEFIEAGGFMLFNSTKADENFMREIDSSKQADKEFRSLTADLSLPGFGKPVTPRKEYRCMSRNQRESLHEAFNFLKNTTDPGYTMSKYDLIIRSHNSDLSPAAHGGPAFLPWHRHYIHLLEEKIKEICPECSIPYWDSRLERRLGGNPQESILFSSDLAGSAVGKVVNGFAANWLAPRLGCSQIAQFLTRKVNTNPELFLDNDIVEIIKKARSLEDLSSPFNTYLETEHGRVHIAVGGHMSQLLCSPLDPLFFLHHVTIDYILQIFINEMNRLGLKFAYPNTSEITGRFSNVLKIFNSAKHRMEPFEVVNEYFINNEYDVIYETSPADVTCERDEDCCQNGNTQFLFCDVDHFQCVTKIAEGGQARPNFSSSQCYCEFGKSPVIKLEICRCE